MTRMGEPGGARMERALVRYTDAASAAGLAPPGAPDPILVDRQLRGLAEALSPWELPAELIALWRLVDVSSLPVTHFREPVDPELARRSYRQLAEEANPLVPPLLLPVAFDGQDYLLVELDRPGDDLEQGRAGGSVFEWGYFSTGFSRALPDFTTYVELLADRLERGRVERHEHTRDDGSLLVWHTIDLDEWAEEAEVLVGRAGPHPWHGWATTYSSDAMRWPERWRRAAGIGPGDVTPTGATTTIAALLEGARDGEVSGTVRAQVGGGAQTTAGQRVTLVDGTGTVDAWCPAHVRWLGQGSHDEFEFDVVVARGPRRPVDDRRETSTVGRAALAGDPRTAQAAALRLFRELFGTAAQAEVRAVRPVR